MILSPAQLRELAASVGFPDPAMAAAVAMVESYGHTDAANVHGASPGVLPERSFGLWQINTLAHPNYDETSLLDPQYNARAAYEVSSGGANWAPWWNTIQSGAYKQYLPPGYTPSAVPTPVPSFPGVTPPARARDASSVFAVVVGLAMAAAAGFATYAGMRSRKPPEPEPEPVPPEPFVYP